MVKDSTSRQVAELGFRLGFPGELMGSRKMNFHGFDT